MSKIKSRKLWSWIIWSLITVTTLVLASEHFPIVIPWYGGITSIYIGSQAAIDFIGKMKVK